jgi:hypothetical protein
MMLAEGKFTHPPGLARQLQIAGGNVQFRLTGDNDNKAPDVW